MKKRTFKKILYIFPAIILISVFMFNVPAPVYADEPYWPAPPEISAGSAILMDADTGAILYDKNSHSKMYPASMTKIMTGLLVIENAAFDEVVKFSSAAANSVKWDEVNIGTKTGEEYTVEQAMYALLLHSANEVAYGLAEHVGGTLSGFSNMMNERARELGALNTHFSNASGLSDDNHYTTAYDMAMIGRACFDNSTFLSIDSYTDYYRIAPTNLTKDIRTLYGRHEMLKGRAYYYQYCKGGKTGFTDESGYTLITFAEKDGMRLIAVTMKCLDEDVRYADTKALFEYGFNNFTKTEISDEDVTSLFNSGSYYNSNVYGSNSIRFSMHNSYIDLPNGVSAQSVNMALNTAALSEAPLQNGYAVDINFMYNENIVGNTSLTINTQNNSGQANNLPYRKIAAPVTPVPKKLITINIWVFSICTGSVLIFLYLVVNVRYTLKRRKQRRYRKRKLHY